MERKRWEEREKEMEETVVQEQEEEWMKNLVKGEKSYRYSRRLMRVQTCKQQEDKRSLDIITLLINFL